MSLTVILNGQPKDFPELRSGVNLANLVAELKMKPDRIAVEHNGEIARRETWDDVQVSNGDRLEVVHFVGGGGLVSGNAGRATLRSVMHYT